MVDFKKLNDKSRLEKLIGMLGSDHDGEVLNAVRFIRKMAEEQKVSLAELLLTGKTQIVEKIVYRDPPMSNHPAAKPFESRHTEYDYHYYGNTRRKYTNEGYDPFAGRTEKPRRQDTRKTLDALLKAGTDGSEHLDFEEIDFATSVPHQYRFDWELTGKQMGKAKAIIRKVKYGQSEPLV